MGKELGNIPFVLIGNKIDLEEQRQVSKEEGMKKAEEINSFFIENLNPEVTCGMHCTGFRFNTVMMRHPSHTLGIVGTEFHL